LHKEEHDVVASFRNDLDLTLTRIKSAEAGQPSLNALLSTGLPTVEGAGGSVVPSRAAFGSTSQTFPRVTVSLSLAVRVGGVTQDTFKLSGNVTLLATDVTFA
jgi:hypothetical protein